MPGYFNLHRSLRSYQRLVGIITRIMVFPESTTRPQSRRTRVPLSMVEGHLNLTVHVSLYRRLESNITRIMGFFDIVNCTSCPDLKYEYSYTSILRLGLTAGDTPDAPHNRLGTRRSSNSPKFPTCFTKIGRHTRILLEELGNRPRTFPRSRFTQRLRKERSGVGPRTTSAREDPPMTPTRRAGESFLASEGLRRTHFRRPLTSVCGCRRQGERKSVPQLPDVTELLDVVVLALG
ncbi:hypothetical protein F511_38966 [Dorcoceras hygrometricum]|uniref:Uncharacterized protein n=1 Tax=Dorcoceras hygrometricum TaxID=472368 RepID=A0A2Z7BCT9_9LAMI|nr:hypothetical protein F511_38966 [Dorcoceras hygrometricum]